jgi:hypothetical protein
MAGSTGSAFPFLPDSLRAWARRHALGYRLRYPYDQWMDWRLGVSTLHAPGYRPAGDDWSSPTLRNEFVPFTYSRLFDVFRQMGLSTQDVLVDLGSGLGRVVFAACHHGVGRAIGVEFDEVLHAGACANLARRRARYPNARFHRMYAEDFDFDGITAITLYHSFGPGTLRKVLGRVEASWCARPRRIRFAYINPRFDDVLDQSDLFHKCADWPASLPYEQLRWFNWYRCGITFHETPSDARAGEHTRQHDTKDDV